MTHGETHVELFPASTWTVPSEIIWDEKAVTSRRRLFYRGHITHCTLRVIAAREVPSVLLPLVDQSPLLCDCYILSMLCSEIRETREGRAHEVGRYISAVLVRAFIITPLGRSAATLHASPLQLREVA